MKNLDPNLQDIHAFLKNIVFEDFVFADFLTDHFLSKRVKDYVIFDATLTLLNFVVRVSLVCAQNYV